MKINKKLKQLLNLSIPSTVENILQALVGFIDTLKNNTAFTNSNLSK